MGAAVIDRRGRTISHAAVKPFPARRRIEWQMCVGIER